MESTASIAIKRIIFFNSEGTLINAAANNILIDFLVACTALVYFSLKWAAGSSVRDSGPLSQKSAGHMQNRKTKTNTNPRSPDPNRYRRRCPDPNAKIQKFIHYMAIVTFAIAALCDSGLSPHKVRRNRNKQWTQKTTEHYYQVCCEVQREKVHHNSVTGDRQLHERDWNHCCANHLTAARLQHLRRLSRLSVASAGHARPHQRHIHSLQTDPTGTCLAFQPFHHLDIQHTIKGKAPRSKKLTAEAIMCGSHRFHTANTPHLPLPVAFHQRAPLLCVVIAAICLQLATHSSTLRGWKAELA